MQIAVMNILTGIFVEQAMKLAQPDRDRLAFEQHRAEIAETNELHKMCQEMDINGDGTIKRSELCEYIEEGKLKAFLMTLGLRLNLKNAGLFFNIIDSASDAIDIETFVQECMNLRGTASNLDLAYLTIQMGALEKRQQEFHHEIMTSLRWMTTRGDTPQLEVRDPDSHSRGQRLQNHSPSGRLPASDQLSSPAEMHTSARPRFSSQGLSTRRGPPWDL